MESNMQSTTTNLSQNVQNNVQQPQQPVTNTSGYVQPVVNNVPQQPVFNNTTTIMNNVPQQPQQPVFTQTVAGEPQTIQLNTQPVQQVTQPIMQTIPTEQQATDISAQSIQATLQNEPVVAQEQPQATLQEQVQKPQHQVIDKVIMDVTKLQYIATQIKQVAKDEGLTPISQICYIVVNKDGFRVYASNKDQVIDVIDDTYSYTTEFNIAVSAKKFINLALNLDPGQVEFIFDDVQKVLTIKTETGRFQFAEQADMSTGLALTINHTVPIDYNTLESIDFNSLLESIDKSKSIRTYAKGLSSSPESRVDGVYCEDGILFSTDSNFVLMQPATQGLTNKNFAMSSELVDIITALDFDTNNVKFGLVENQGIILTDGKITLSSIFGQPLDENAKQVCLSFYNVDYNIKMIIDTKKCLSILKRITPFIEVGTDDDNVLYKINGNILQVESLQGSGLDTVNIENTQNYNANFKLPVQRTQKLLSTLTDSTFVLTVNPEQQQTVCFNFENFKCVASLSE